MENRIRATLEGRGGYGSFMDNLIKAVLKADGVNQSRLRRGFPQLMAEYERWLYNKPEPEEWNWEGYE